MEKLSMGWLADNPDFRDYTSETPEVKQLLQSVSAFPKRATKAKAGALTADAAPLALPATIDLRAFCSPIEDQGGIGSCTANAGAGLLEYFERKAFGSHVEASRLFLYKATRNLLHWSGDTGAYLRTTMKAMAMVGACPEEYWPYSDSMVVPVGSSVAPFDMEPTSFCYALGENYKATTYYRLDPLGTPYPTVLANIKNHLTAGLPSMFGFTVYQSYSTAGANQGKFPFPSINERVVGGHAVVAVGYNDTMVISNPLGGPTTTGALLVRNSWGTSWGTAGYGWIPYEYVLRGLASDFWSLIKADYINTGNF
jgi:C1A family cysteine protease